MTSNAAWPARSDHTMAFGVPDVSGVQTMTIAGGWDSVNPLQESVYNDFWVTQDGSSNCLCVLSPFLTYTQCIMHW